MQSPRIDVVGLCKSYGRVGALVDVTLRAAAGTVLGVLGHNGAGKTTLIDILATRTSPTAGSARVGGFDVVRDGHRVRRLIGMIGQFAALDESMSGRGNLILVARLLGASPRQARARADELIEVFGLTDVAPRRVVTYSGGLRRRLDLAMSLVGRPAVLFLDEPSTGLDPLSRAELWRFVARLATGGTTVVLTTQYLEEADQLATGIVVLGAGHVVAAGTPAELKAGVGTRAATARFADTRTTDAAVALLRQAGLIPLPDDRHATIMVPLAAAGDVVDLVRALDAAGIRPRDLTVAEPTLTDVYVSLHRASGAQAWPATPR